MSIEMPDNCWGSGKKVGAATIPDTVRMPVQKTVASDPGSGRPGSKDAEFATRKHCTC